MKQWKEEDHPRDAIGRFTGYGSIVPGKGEASNKWETDTIKRPDETLPRSVGAKWANHLAEIHCYEEPLVGKVEFKF
ncbi:MAG: hypothetical protein IJY01_00385 [Clostridia bacterium]|nr:hypothetical protein [Clostridia bacterium]